MIHELDETIRALLTQEMPQVAAGGIEISFEQPTRTWSSRLGAKTVLNFFLYDVRDNPTLRQHQWQTTQDSRNSAGGNKHVRQKRTPLRIDCFYLVTAWSYDADPTKRPRTEHQVLAECLKALARYPILNRPDSALLMPGQTLQRGTNQPAAQATQGATPTSALQQLGAGSPCQFNPFLQGALCTDQYEIPTRLAYHDVMTNPAELWGSLDNDIHAGFSYVVNLPIDPWEKIEYVMGEVGAMRILSRDMTTPPA